MEAPAPTRVLVVAPARPVSAKTLGVLAVVGVVVGFSLSSTLVKRADAPGVLIALWRMVTVSVLWNVLLWHTRRRVTRADVRQVWLPGVFFGLAIAVLFGAVTRNSVANAALIGALAPFRDRPARCVAVQGVLRAGRRSASPWSRSAGSRSCCSTRRPAVT